MIQSKDFQVSKVPILRGEICTLKPHDIRDPGSMLHGSVAHIAGTRQTADDPI